MADARAIGAIRGKRRRVLLYVHERVPFGFMRVERVRGGVSVSASSASWGAHAAANLAASARPAGVP